MRRLALFSAALVLIGVTAAFAAEVPGQNAQGIQREDGVWHVRGDNGEIVHVFADINSAENAEHRFGGMQGFQGLQNPSQPMAERAGAYSVFQASYGSIPGQLDDHGGAVVSNAAFLPIFWNAATAAALQSGIDAFVGNFSNSDPGMKVITQYSKSGNAISASLTHSSDFVDNQSAPRRISDNGVRSYLTGLFNGGRIPVSTHTVYGVYLPQGTTSTLGSSRSCTSYCGYHSSYTYNGNTILYAVYPYLDCNGCTLSGKTVVNMETIVTSHEIREAITDPVNAWWESTSGYEADDKCAWHNLYQQSGGAWVQPEYSNSLAGWPRGCVTP